MAKKFFFEGQNNEKMLKSAIFLGFSHIAPQPDLTLVNAVLTKNSHCFVSDELSVHKTDTVADKLNRTINVALANQKHCQVLDSTVNIFSQTR